MRRELDTWISYKEKIRWSKNSVQSAKYWGKRFLSFMEKEYNISNLSQAKKEHLDGYRRYITKYTTSCQSRYVSLCRNFFSWCVSENLILASPCSHWKKFIVIRTDPPVLTVSEVEIILNAIDTSTIGGIQRRTIIETFYSTAMRRTELQNLTIYDLNFENKQITIINGKGQKDRIVPVPSSTIFWLKLYVNDVRKQLIKKGDSLFVSPIGCRISTVYIYDICKEIKQKTGLYVHPHLLRHSCATHLMQAGVPLIYIQKLLGHKHLYTTQTYLHVKILNNRKIFELAHPREKWSIRHKN